MAIENLNTILKLAQFFEVPQHIRCIPFEKPPNTRRKQRITRKYTLLGLKLIDLLILTRESLLIEDRHLPSSILPMKMIQNMPPGMTRNIIHPHLRLINLYIPVPLHQQITPLNLPTILLPSHNQ